MTRKKRSLNKNVINKNAKNHVVYEIKRPVETNDLRKYIGVSHYNENYSPSDRFYQHSKSSHYVGNFIRKYSDATMHIIFSNLTMEEAYNLERELVPDLHTERIELNLLNETGGGKENPSYYKFSVEKQKEISENTSKSLLKFYENELNRKKRSQEMLDFHERNPNARIKQSEAKQKYFSNIKNRKPYEVLSPDNIIYTEKDFTLNQLCIKFNLTATNLSRVLNGKLLSLKGWRLPSNKDYVPNIFMKFKLKSPTGETFEGENLSAFCKIHGLYSLYVGRMIKGRRGIGPKIYKRYKSHRGWTVVD